MSEHTYDIQDPTPADDIIEHQERVEAVIEEELTDNVTSNDARYVKRGTATIASPTTPGSTYSQAEMASLKTAIDAIRAALTAQHVTG